ncbi:MAG TPA: helix-turn-helix domain-containing protein [Caldilineaceae bacterium]|nr:helix-turn-helix domain-containing protein [Caldilineaceae bacterium]
MDFIFEERAAESPFVDLIWRTQSERAGSFTSTAGSNSELVVTRYEGQTSITLRGPETKASHAEFPAEAEFLGIRFKLGVFMPHLPPSTVMDRNDASLPVITNQSFWLQGATWRLPTYENADTFVEWLVRYGVLVQEPVVAEVLANQLSDLSLRSLQRRFVRATGLTHGTVVQIERAQQAMTLLQQGVSILDTVELAGYADQPHLTRSLKRFIGRTPAQLLGASRAE